MLTTGRGKGSTRRLTTLVTTFVGASCAARKAGVPVATGSSAGAIEAAAERTCVVDFFVAGFLEADLGAGFPTLERYRLLAGFPVAAFFLTDFLLATV
jgi:hypothetical protein